MKPFEDKEKVDTIKKERDRLLAELQDFEMEETERMFIIRKINNITEKLLKAAEYGK
jgi:hypothetical protein